MEYLSGLIVQSGYNCNRITTVAGCEQMARKMGLKDTTAWVGSWSSYPPYCNMADCGSNGCSTLYFNEYPGANGTCTSSDRCICSTTGKQFLFSAFFIFNSHIMSYTRKNLDKVWILCPVAVTVQPTIVKEHYLSCCLDTYRAFTFRSRCTDSVIKNFVEIENFRGQTN